MNRIFDSTEIDSKSKYLVVENSFINAFSTQAPDAINFSLQ